MKEKKLFHKKAINPSSQKSASTTEVDSFSDKKLQIHSKSGIFHGKRPSGISSYALDEIKETDSEYNEMNMTTKVSSMGHESRT